MREKEGKVSPRAKVLKVIQSCMDLHIKLSVTIVSFMMSLISTTKSRIKDLLFKLAT